MVREDPTRGVNLEKTAFLGVALSTVHTLQRFNMQKLNCRLDTVTELSPYVAQANSDLYTWPNDQHISRKSENEQPEPTAQVGPPG